MKINRKNIVLLSLVMFAVLITATIYLTLDYHAINNESIEIINSAMDNQKDIDKKMTSENYTIDNPNIIINPYNNSPLTALIIFETTKEVEPKVTIVGKDIHTTFSHQFQKKTIHFLPIYGLYADKNNEVIIEYEGIKKTIYIKTASLPKNMIVPTSIYADKSNLANELYFFTPSSIGYTCAYDINGDVRWYFDSFALWEISRLKNGHLLVGTDRLVNPPYYVTGLYEIDLLGKIYTEYSLEGGYHHDYFEMENGNFLIATNNFSDGTVEDIVVELNRRTGKIIKTFNLKEILNMNDGKSENWTSYDWFHNNSVWYDQKTNSITLSGRHQDAVINIDYKTKKLNWIIGDKTNWSKEYHKYFFEPVGELEWQWSQHAAKITPEGDVFLLDNGNNKSKLKQNYISADKSYTRGVIYRINQKNKTIEQIWQYGKERGSDFYSPYISDVDYLEKNHYLIHSGGICYCNNHNLNCPPGLAKADKLVSDTVEILDNKVIFEIILPTNNYRSEKMSLYYPNEKFSITESKQIGTLGKTKIDEVKKGYIFSKKIYSNHNIKVTKEYDRLVVNGTFKKNQKVKVLLYRNMKSNIYNINISYKPYTALCLDVFDDLSKEDEIEVNKYINREGLNGKYSIYLEIDGIIYNTNKYVNFD